MVDAGTNSVAYFALHMVGYVAFVVIGLRLCPFRRPVHWVALGCILAICDLWIAHVAYWTLHAGMGTLANWHAWWPLGRGRWGSPLFFVATTAVYASFIRPFPWAMLDVAGIGWLVANAFFKLACLVQQCCLGPVCSPAWPIAIGGHHALPLYEAAFHVSAAGVLFMVRRSGRMYGRLWALALLCYGGLRLVAEPYRIHPVIRFGHDGMLTLTQLVSIVGVAFAAGVLIFSRWGEHNVSATGDTRNEPGA